MLFIKVGSRAINLDNVEEITEVAGGDKDQVRIFFVSGHNVDLEGEEGARFKRVVAEEMMSRAKRGMQARFEVQNGR